jgi:hypothetical protein
MTTQAGGVTVRHDWPLPASSTIHLSTRAAAPMMDHETGTNQRHDNDNWLMVAGLADGEPRMYRIRVELPMDIVRETFQECVIIEWRYAAAGFPDKRTTALHSAFEGLLDSLNDPNANSILVHAYTGGGIKEWCYYVKSYDRYMADLNNALAGKPRFPIEIMHDSDPTWKYWSGIKEVAVAVSEA